MENIEIPTIDTNWFVKIFDADFHWPIGSEYRLSIEGNYLIYSISKSSAQLKVIPI